MEGRGGELAGGEGGGMEEGWKGGGRLERVCVCVCVRNRQKLGRVVGE